MLTSKWIVNFTMLIISKRVVLIALHVKDIFTVRILDRIIIYLYLVSIPSDGYRKILSIEGIFLANVCKS